MLWGEAQKTLPKSLVCCRFGGFVWRTRSFIEHITGIWPQISAYIRDFNLYSYLFTLFSNRESRYVVGFFARKVLPSLTKIPSLLENRRIYLGRPLIL